MLFSLMGLPIRTIIPNEGIAIGFTIAPINDYFECVLTLADGRIITPQIKQTDVEVLTERKLLDYIVNKPNYDIEGVVNLIEAACEKMSN